MEHAQHRFDFFMSFCGVTLMLMIVISCTGVSRIKNESGNSVSKLDIKMVLNDHTQELMAIDGVVGVALGELEDHTPCILVLIVEETDEIKAKIPTVLDGHPVSILVTGEFSPMGGN